MASLKPGECGKNIKSGNYDNLYLFYGRDTGALEPFAKKLAQKLCPKEMQVMNLHSFDAASLDMEALSDSVNVLPMFAERVVVTINSLNMDSLNKTQGDLLRKIIADVPETTVLIISAQGEELYKNRRSLTDKNKRFAELCAKYGTVVEFAFKTEYEASKMIENSVRKNGCSISPKNAKYLAELCLCETAHINSEISKLCSFADGNEITREDIDALCVRKIESDGYSLALQILNSNAVFVFRRISELRAQNYEPTQILSIISMSLTDIYRAKLARSAGKGWQDCAADFRYPKNREFAIKNAFSECSNISLDKIRKAQALLSRTEYRMKSVSMGTADAFFALEQYAAAAMDGN